jgi:xanthine dehydrogenase large subunit
MGWATLEQIRYGADGKVLTGVNAYKIPDIKFVPSHFDITLLKDSSNPFAICNSKAVGEPPFVHGIGAYLALADALRYVRRDKDMPSLPLTPEKVFMYLHGPAL